MKTNKGIPVKLTPNDRYTFRIDAEDIPDSKLKALRTVLNSLSIDWEEFYVLGDNPCSQKS